MDILRDGNISDNEYMKLCRTCIETNDIRFRIKNKINLISNSELKEQKSYKINRLLIELYCNKECLHLFIDPIKYFSYIYDEIIIHHNDNIDLIKNTFHYDTTIKYNIDISYLAIKQNYNFYNKLYNINEIYEIMNINNKIINLYN